jgi:2-oxoglutarate dehydrogenase E1 component
LRDPRVVSTVIAIGSFQNDDGTVDKEGLKSCVCTGKFYYDIIAEGKNREKMLLLRIEQLFPLPVEQLKAIIAKYQMLMTTFGRRRNRKNMGLMVLCR